MSKRLDKVWCFLHFIFPLSNFNVARQTAMSEAREKAKEEIEKYRAEMEKEYEEKKSNVLFWYCV